MTITKVYVLVYNFDALFDMKILIVGVGLIGGSFSLALKGKRNLLFGGYDLNRDALSKAEELGIISKSFNAFEEALAWADVIILSIPVAGIKTILPQILNSINAGQYVVDFGSTKSSICQAVKDHPKRNQFIAAHPIAGTEHSGPEAAFAELYQAKNLILCDTERSDPLKLKEFEVLAADGGFYLTKMNSEEHDRHLAYISHLSHITSYALSNAVLKKEKDGEVILDLAGSGFESTVRLAKSSPSMWSSIFLENKEMVLKGIEAYKKELERLEQYIQDEDGNAVSKYLEEGREIRKILK
ncbi:MAG: prephenate dehydrogenase [Bacteroidota bacterium]